MFCTQCGAEVPAGANFCGKCGKQVWPDTKPQEKLPAPQPTTLEADPGTATHLALPYADPKQVGVYGWLRFLCVMLGVLTPLAILGTVKADYEAVVPLYPQFPQFRTVFAIEATCGAITALLSMLTAVALWKRYEGAVVAAKAFLLLTVFLALVQLGAFSEVSGLPPEVTKVLVDEGLIGVGRSFGSCVVWYCYLKFSTRVRKTYEPGSAAGPLREWPLPLTGIVLGLAVLAWVLYRWFLNL